MNDYVLSFETLNEMEMDSIIGGTNDANEPTYNCMGGYCAAGCGIKLESDSQGQQV